MLALCYLPLRCSRSFNWQEKNTPGLMRYCVFRRCISPFHMTQSSETLQPVCWRKTRRNRSFCRLETARWASELMGMDDGLRFWSCSNLVSLWCQCLLFSTHTRLHTAHPHVPGMSSPMTGSISSTFKGTSWFFSLCHGDVCSFPRL